MTQEPTLLDSCSMLFSRAARARWRIRSLYVPMSDDEFLERLDLPATEDQDLALTMRRVVAQMCGGVEPDYLDPAMHLEGVIDASCSRGVTKGWDDLDFAFRLEKMLGLVIAERGPDFTGFEQMTKAGNARLGDWLRQAIPNIRSQLRSLPPASARVADPSTNPFTSPHAETEISTAAATILRQSRPAVLVLVVATGLFALVRATSILFAIRYLLWARQFSGGGFGNMHLGLIMGFYFLQAMLSVMICRTLLRYLRHIALLEVERQASIKPLCVFLKAIWNKSALLVAAIAVEWAILFAFRFRP